MLVKFGSYSHPENETQISPISLNVTRGPTGLRTSVKQQWTVKGRLAAASVAALTTAIQALEAAHASDGYDLVLYEDSGSTASAHAIESARTIGGVKVVSLTYPEGRGAEYATFRNYEVTYEAETLSSIGGIDSWRESVELWGGGPAFEFVEPVDGAPVKVWTKQKTSYKASQSGNAVGIGTWPSFPTPLFGQHEHVDRRKKMRGTPEYDGAGQSRYPISWSYEFESASPLNAFPGNPFGA